MSKISRGTESKAKRTKMERKVIETALADYRRLRDLGWTGKEELGGTALQHFMACKRLDVFLVGRAK